MTRLRPPPAPARAADRPAARGVSRDGAGEDQLVARARDGDESAFTVLVDRYFPRCLRFAFHMLGNRADAEEAVQDAFVCVHRALPSYEHRERFDSWLLRILANHCRSRRRRRRWERVVFTTDVAEALRRPSHESVADRLAAREELEAALRTIPADQAEAFLLRHVAGLEYDEIAAVTGMRASSLRMRVMRACRRMRRYLDDVARTPCRAEPRPID